MNVFIVHGRKSDLAIPIYGMIRILVHHRFEFIFTWCSRFARRFARAICELETFDAHQEFPQRHPFDLSRAESRCPARLEEFAPLQKSSWIVVSVIGVGAVASPGSGSSSIPASAAKRRLAAMAA